MGSVLAALLGVVQGLTEFLPVSSSAHLILARAFFGWDAGRMGLAFDVACHVGTLLAVVVYFWRDLVGMARALPGLFDPHPSPPARLARLIVVGTIPAVLAGLLFGDVIEDRLRTPVVAAVTLGVVAVSFFAVEALGRRTRAHGTLTAAEALGIGVAQASALVPGVSRSGATIVVGMVLGLRREEAARFAFLLGIPAILAAAGREGVMLLERGLSGGEAQLFAVGMASSAVVGYFTVKYFLRYLTGHSLAIFAWYRLLLAGAVVVWLFVR
ncbi:MAG: undecaprenyl-diphosphatase UppP [Acidobacteria bacterium]|nr:undecaprenyl-diphosphatase UppP [Acidobacteriota bacterium]